jgi:hypothetical protein
MTRKSSLSCASGQLAALYTLAALPHGYVVVVCACHRGALV